MKRKKMFGGVGFLVYGNMSVGVIGDDICVRVGPERDETVLEQPHVRPFDFTGKPMSGWIYVAREGTEEDEDLKEWVAEGVEFAISLPPK
jgi:TfoX/Sxy family transcriptional regulator of competence genes